MWKKYINKEVYTANCDFKEKDLQKIAEEYEFLGRLTPKQTAENPVSYTHLVAPHSASALSSRFFFVDGVTTSPRSSANFAACSASSKAALI